MNYLMKQKGFTLPELLISIAVGIILSAGVIKIYASNKQAYRLADAEARIQENARFALEVIGSHLRHAGFRGKDVVENSFDTVFPEAELDQENYAQGQIIVGQDDKIAFRFQGEGVLTECEDNTPIPVGTIVSIRFSLDEDGNLKCGSSLDNGGDQPFLSDVSSLEFLYGVDTDGDEAANRYDRAAGITDWSEVVSVRVKLLLSSGDENISVEGGALEREYSATFAIRNRLP